VQGQELGMLNIFLPGITKTTFKFQDVALLVELYSTVVGKHQGEEKHRF
jgi:cyanate permease